MTKYVRPYHLDEFIDRTLDLLSDEFETVLPRLVHLYVIWLKLRTLPRVCDLSANYLVNAIRDNDTAFTIDFALCTDDIDGVTADILRDVYNVNTYDLPYYDIASIARNVIPIRFALWELNDRVYVFKKNDRITTEWEHMQ